MILSEVTINKYSSWIFKYGYGYYQIKSLVVHFTSRSFPIEFASKNLPCDSFLRHSGGGGGGEPFFFVHLPSFFRCLTTATGVLLHQCQSFFKLTK